MDEAVGQRQEDREQAFHALLLDRMNVAVIATDPDLRIRAWNRAAEVLYGWPPEEAIGRPVRELIGPLVIADEQEGAAQHPVLQHRRDGRTLIIEGDAVPVHAPDGTLAGYVAVVHDVTGQARLCGDLAESEEKYRNLVELSPDAILIHQNGVITFANRAAAALVGAGGPHDLVGMPVLEIVHPAARRNVEWNIAADLRGEESPITLVEVVRRDGTTITVQGRGARIPMGGRPAVQVVLRDVTAQSRTAAAEDEDQTAFRLTA